MAEDREQYIRIENNKAARLIALVLRDEKKMSPDEANALASTICTRLRAAMPLPTRPALRWDRAITSHPSFEIDENSYVAAVQRIVKVEERDAIDLWKLVYSFCRELPEDLVQ